MSEFLGADKGGSGTGSKQGSGTGGGSGGAGGPPPEGEAPPPSDAPAGEPAPAESPAPSPGETPTDAGSPGESGGGAPPGGGGKEPSAPSSSANKPKRGPADLSTAKIGFVGAGRMTEALIKGFVKYGKVDGNRLHVAAPSTKNLQRLKDQYQLHATKRSMDIFARYDCDIVFLTFHGNVIRQCFKTGSSERPAPFTVNYIPRMGHPVYLCSLVSGVSLKDIKKCLLQPEKVDRYLIEAHRIVANTAVAYGMGLISVDADPDNSKRFAPVLKQLLSSVGKLEKLSENEMDASCALSGAGLAFSHYYISALAESAFKAGLPRDVATRMAARTVQSACQSLIESGKHPSELRDAAAGAGGAASHGIHKLDSQNVGAGVVAAIEAAGKRSAEQAQ